jgi:threonine aldolase
MWIYFYELTVQLLNANILDDIQNSAPVYEVMKIIDLRSDTVTLPTAEMRQAMSEAELGDDVYGEDPTVNRLERMAAERMGKEAALFTTSGTQSNLIAVLTHTRHGNEILVGNQSHMFWYEVGGSAALGGVVMHNLPNDSSGCLDPAEVVQSIRIKNIHNPETTLLCLENTHNRCGGAVLTPGYIRDICRLVQPQGVKVHMDGARIFNAAIFLGIPASRIAESVDSVSFCISKGLSAPVGSLLCGELEFINRARKFRKMLGGGMRQAGVLAAAGIVALETMVERLVEDHLNARRLAGGLASIPGIKLAQEEVTTNIVMFDLSSQLSPGEFVRGLEDAGVKVGSRGGNLFRAVTHRMISAGDVEEGLVRIEAVGRNLQYR